MLNCMVQWLQLCFACALQCSGFGLFLTLEYNPLTSVQPCGIFTTLAS